MKDAFGGILNLVLIAIFLLLVEGILGMVVNYTKAFKMKNVVVSAIEKYEGNSDSCTKSSGACVKHIKEGAKSIGYSPVILKCPSDYVSVEGLFCCKEIKGDDNRKSYRVITQVDINFPIIRNIMTYKFFQVTGDTRMIDVP